MSVKELKLNFKQTVKMIKRPLVITSLLSGLLFSGTTSFSQENNTLQDVQQIVAIVNDELISVYDLQQRALLFLMSSGNRQINDEEKKYLQQQAIQSLIDDKLKVQELTKYNMNVSSEEKEQRFKAFANQVRVSPEQLNEQLTQMGITKASMLTQIEGSLAWNNLVSGLLMPQVNIADEEIYAVLDRFESNKGQDELHYREIFLLVSDNSQHEPSKIAAGKIVENLRNKASFQVMARQFSHSTTAAVGGDLGWRMKSEIPEKILKSLDGLKNNQISDPIETEDGFYILELVGRRKVLTADPLDTKVDLKYLYFPAENGNFNATELKASIAASNISTCEKLEEKKGAYGAADAGSLGVLKVSDLSPSLHDQMLNTEVGKSTNPVKEDGGYRLFIICNKESPKINTPTYDSISQNLSNQRVGLIARRHLRDLRRDAIIDYR